MGSSREYAADQEEILARFRAELLTKMGQDPAFKQLVLNYAQLYVLQEELRMNKTESVLLRDTLTNLESLVYSLNGWGTNMISFSDRRQLAWDIARTGGIE